MLTRLVILLFFLTPYIASAGQSSHIVERFVQAFNDKDIDAMLVLAAPDIRWMSVSGTKVSVEASGQDDLRLGMTDYFKSLPSASASLLSINASGAFVTTIERASWLSGDIEKSQCSLAVYELSAAKIKNVWYYPEHPC